MKNFTLLLVLIACGMLYGEPETNKPTDIQNHPFFVGIVVDSSPTSGKTWNIRKSRAIELISCLEEGDKIVVLKARPGSPTVYGATMIGGHQKSGANEIVSRVSVLNKELLSGTDVARACESIYDLFISEGQDFKCLLVVLTSGKISTSQTEHIIRTASQINTINGLTCLTYDPSVARQDLINAGKRNDLELLLESNPGFANWIQSKRSSIQIEPAPVVEKTEYVIVEPNLAPFTTMLDDALTSIKSEVTQPPTKVTEYIIKEVPVIKEPNIIKTDTLPQTVPTDDESGTKDVPHDGFPVVQVILGGLTLVAIMLILKALLRRSSVSASAQDQISEQPGGNLKAIIGEQNVDLGPLYLISELTMGNDPGCSIFTEEDDLSPEIARIIHANKGFKLHNLDPMVIYVNGEEVAGNKKIKFELPADIQLPNGSMLNLFIEIPPEMEGEEHGKTA